VAERAVQTVELGYGALKWDPFGPVNNLIEPEQLRASVAQVRAVREAVGPNVELLIEAHGKLNVNNAIRAGRMLEALDPYWFEEPVDPENVDAMAGAARALVALKDFEEARAMLTRVPAAQQNHAEVAAARSAIALAAATVIGLAVGGRVALRGTLATDAADHDHGSRVDAFASHLTGDFLSMGRFIVLGAALAAFLQTVVPQSALANVAGTPVVAELALMAVAFSLSLCSEADAFVAASLGAFGLGPQLAFLVFGPIADAKLTILYSGTFRRLFALRVLGVAAPVALVGSMLAARVIG
jgi:hypothetical protein